MLLCAASGLLLSLGDSPATTDSVAPQQELRFGSAAPRAESEWAFHRTVQTRMRCRAWMNDQLARDQELSLQEEVGRAIRRLPDAESEGKRVWSVSYRRDTRNPSLRDFTTTAERSEDGELIFPELLVENSPEFQNTPANLSRDHDRLGKAHPLAELVSERTMSPGDEVAVPADVASDLLETQIVRVSSVHLVFVGETKLDGVSAGSFRLSAQASSKAKDRAGAVTELELSGSLILRASDGAPMSLNIAGPVTVKAEWTERIDAKMRLEGEGTANVELRWGPASILKEPAEENGAGPEEDEESDPAEAW